MSLVGYNTLPGSTRVRTPNGLVRLDQLSGSGPVGPQGPSGPAGNDGATGPQGPAGEDGEIGRAHV